MGVNDEQKQNNVMLKKITITWTTEDVKKLARERFRGLNITDDQAWEILKKVKEKHDANEGINWNVLEIYVTEWVKNKESKATFLWE